MKYVVKAVSALAVTAVLLTACGAVTSEELPPSLPPVASGGSARVNSHDADAPSEEQDHTASVITSSADTAVSEEPEAESEQETQTVTDSEKEEFSFTPEYDEEFFTDDLFIGDSITTGYSGYGILDEKNVFAKIGLNPLSALTTEVYTPDGDMLLSEAVSLAAPKRAYIMLGSNGIDWLPCSNMLDGISEVIDAVREANPETQVICLSVPPVTKEFDEENTELDVMDKINDYNSRLGHLCAEKEVGYIDITTVLEDNEGYFVYYYAEKDGVHFKPTAYKLILSKIEYTLS